MRALLQAAMRKMRDEKEEQLANAIMTRRIQSHSVRKHMGTGIAIVRPWMLKRVKDTLATYLSLTCVRGLAMDAQRVRQWGLPKQQEAVVISYIWDTLIFDDTSEEAR